MSFFGIMLFDDVDLPEFPFPDLGRHKHGDGAPEEPTASPRRPQAESARARQRLPGPLAESALVL
jgi:hypothetical protein